jgi:hypothetical protein
VFRQCSKANCTSIKEGTTGGSICFMAVLQCDSCVTGEQVNQMISEKLRVLAVSSQESEPMEAVSAGAGNRIGDRTEVSRGNSGQMLTVMGGTRRSPEHNE